jgi:uncharacterized protein (TIGR02996 family)
VTFDAFVSELAKAPDDAGLRATFADWLLSQGDSRGEALVLEGRDPRRLDKLRKTHAKSWLGSLAEHADVDACEFRGGFPVKVALHSSPKGPVEPAATAFLEDVFFFEEANAFLGVLANLKRLRGPIGALASLRKNAMPWHLELCEITIEPIYETYRQLAESLDRVADVTALRAAPTYLRLPGFIEPLHADFLAEAVLRSSLAERDVLGLMVRQGAFDAVSHWLSWAPSWGAGSCWTARYEGLELSARRDDDDGRFRILQLELETAAPKVVAVAAAILSQLQALSPHRIDVTVPMSMGVRARKQMLDTLQAAQRMLPSVSKLRVVQKKTDSAQKRSA